MRDISGPGTLSAEAQSRHTWPRPFVKDSAQDAMPSSWRAGDRSSKKQVGPATEARFFIPEQGKCCRLRSGED